MVGEPWYSQVKRSTWEGEGGKGTVSIPRTHESRVLGGSDQGVGVPRRAGEGTRANRWLPGGLVSGFSWALLNAGQAWEALWPIVLIRDLVFITIDCCEDRGLEQRKGRRWCPEEGLGGSSGGWKLGASGGTHPQRCFGKKIGRS